MLTKNRFCAVVVMLLLGVVGASAASAQGSLNFTNTPPLNPTGSGSGTGGTGASIEIVNVGTTPIKIWRIGTRAGSTGSRPVHISTRVGGAFTTFPVTASSQLQSTGWVNHGSAIVNFVDTTTTIQIPVDINVVVQPNQVLGIAHSHEGQGFTARYHSSPPSPWVNSNADIEFRHPGIAGSFSTVVGSPMHIGSFAPRGAVCTIWYDYDQITGTHAQVEEVRVNNNTGLIVGNNTIEAVIRNMGTLALDNVPLTLEYSTNGGTTWVGNQTFTIPSFPSLTNQTVAFTLPFTTTATASQEIRVRFPTAVGQGIAEKTRTFVPDLDVDAISLNLTPPQLNTPMDLSVTVRNNGAWNHNGASLPLRYRVDSGSWINQTFNITTLNAANATEVFTFTQQVTFPAQATYVIDVEFQSQLTGDPDTLDSGSRSYQDIGVTIVNMDLARYSLGKTTPPTASTNAFPLGMAGPDASFGSMWTPAELGTVGNIVSFGWINGTQLGTRTWNNVKYYMGETSITSTTGIVATTPYLSYFISPPVLVYDGPLSVTSTAPDSFTRVTLQTPYVYTGLNNLLVYAEFSGAGGTGGQWARVFTGGSPALQGYRLYNTSGITPAPAGVQANYGVGASFGFTPPSAVDLDIDSVTFGAAAPFASGPAIGSNTINVTIRTFGGSPFTGTYNLEYSTNGGTNWVTNAPFQASGLNQVGNSQTVTFTTPWVVSGPLAPQSLMVRINPVVAGDPDTVDQVVLNYAVDADVDSVAFTGVTTSLNQPLTVRATIKNGGGMNLNGQSIPLRYTINGSTFTSQSFTATTLTGLNDTEEFTFTTPLSIGVAGNHTLTVGISPQLVGDPDTTDSNSTVIPDVGATIINVGPTQFGIPTFTTNTIPWSQAAGSYMTFWTPAQLNNTVGNVSGFGFQMANAGINKQITNVKITMGEMSATGFTTNTPFLSYFNAGAPATVIYDGPLTMVTTTAGEYLRWPATTPYLYSGQNNLAVLVDITGNDTTTGQLAIYSGTQNPNQRYYVSGAVGTQGTGFNTGYGHGASFSFTAPSAVDLDMFGATYGPTNNGGPSVGSNIVNARVRHMGGTPFTGNVSLGYSVDNGANWVSQTFTNGNFVQTGDFQDFSFTTPWVVAGPLAPQSIQLRVSPQPVGDPDPSDVITLNYAVDADIDAINIGGITFALNNPITIKPVIRNNGGMSLNGTPLSLRYTIDAGTNWVTQQFTPTTLGGNGDTEEFSFTTPAIFTTSGNKPVTVEFSPQVGGDPDTSDTLTTTIQDVGNPILNLVQADFPGATGLGSNAIPFGNYGASVGYATMWTPEQMRYRFGEILEFGWMLSGIFNKTYPQMKVWMGEAATAATLGTASFMGLFDIPSLPPQLVYDGPATFDVTVADSYVRHVMTNPYLYSGQNNLVVYIELLGSTSTIGGTVRYYSGGGHPNYRLYNTTASGPNSVGIGTQWCHPASFVFGIPADPGIAVSRVGNPAPIDNGGFDDLGIALTATVPATVDYTITNRGPSLPLGITSITVSDQLNCTAALSGPAPTTVAFGGGTANFGLNVTAGSGPFSYKVTIVNNTSHQPNQTYVLNVSGVGFVNTAPQIVPLGGGGAGILITEVSSDQSTSPSTGSEWIELTNVSASPINISGWKVYVYEGTTTTPYSGYPRTLIGATVPGSTTYTMVDSGTLFPGLGESLGSNILWNGGASGGVVLVDAQDQIVDAMFFGSIDPSLVQIPLGTSTVGVGTEWIGPPLNAVTVFQSSMIRSGASDNDNASDWSQATGHSLSQVNATMTVPFAGGDLQVSGVHPNYLVETVVGSGLTILVKSDDVDTHQTLTLSVDTATGGTLTPAQAGFTTTTFPMTATPGGTPRVVVLLGTAAASGTVNFTATSSDNGHFPGSDTINFTVKIGARLDVDLVESSSVFTRVSGQKDFYRGQTGQPIDIRVSNNNPFAITLNSLDISVQPAAGGGPLTGFTFNTPSLPMSIPANTTNMQIPCTMDIAANASGGHDLACELTVNTGLAVDPVSPTTNPIIVIVGAPADEFQLFDGPVPTPMSISMTGFLPAVETVAYLQELTVTGGLGTFTWSITSGTLPAGLTLNASGSTILNASISGTPALASAGPYPLTLQVSDGAYLATTTLTLTVSQLTPLNFNAVTLANAREYVPYTMTTPLVATGGSLIYTYGIDTFLGDDLPQGLTLNTNTGVITGTPAFLEAGTYSLYFTVDDGISLLTQPLPTDLVVEAHPLQWNTTVLPTANETVSYNFTLDTIGGTGPRLYSITSTGTLGVLPNGLTLDAQTGVISGVPAVGTSGTYTITFKVDSGPTETQSQNLTLDVVLPPPLTITTAALSYAEVGQSFSLQIAASGGSQNYTFSTGGGVLSIPNSVALSANGELSGTPEFGQDGKFAITVVVNDGYGTVSKTFDFSVLAPHQSRVKITEVDVGTGYIELASTSTTTPVDMTGWRVVAWVDGNTPTSLTFDTIPGASLALPGEVVMVNMGGTAGGTWPTFATGSTWTATSTSNLAVALYDIHGTLNDFVAIGTVNVAALEDAAAAPANIHPDFASVTPLQNGAANHRLGANSTFTGSAAGSPGAYNTGLPAQALDLIKDDLKVAVEGAAYWDFTIAKGGAKPYVYSMTAPGAAWLSISASTGVITGTVPASAAGTVVVDLTVTDASLAVVTETINLTILAASATPSATFTVGQGEGQSFEGVIIDVPVTLSLATGVTGINGFSFAIDMPAATAAELAFWRVLPGGATLGAGRGVIARDIGNDRIYVSDIDLGGGTEIASGVVAIVQFIVPSDDNVEAPEDTYAVNIAEVSAVGLITPILATGVNGGMELSNYAPADVNRDNIIDVVDVQLTVNIILSLFTPTYAGQGDANLDTLVDVVDVQTVVNCILFGGCN